MGRASKDKRDIFYRKAKEEGYRARSAYKLLHINALYPILDHIESGVVDLCAAPGSWSQVLSRVVAQRHHAKQQQQQQSGNEEASPCPPPPPVIAVDLQEMAPIPGVTTLQGDITTAATAAAIIAALGGVRSDVVVCDGAPDVTGLHELDEYLQHHLLLAALRITTHILKPGGAFVTKMFRGPNTPFLIAKSEVFFDSVRVVKPLSSRNTSLECFLLCEHFRGAAGDALDGDEALQRKQRYRVEEGEGVQSAKGSGGTLSFTSVTAGGAAPLTSSSWAQSTTGSTKASRFLACGDLSGWDADRCYDVEGEGEGEAVEREEQQHKRTRGGGAASSLPPVQPPLQAPYLAPSC